MVEKLEKHRGGYAVFYKDMITKRQKLELIMVVLLAFICIGCLFLANNSKGMVQIPVFKAIYESVKIAVEFAYGICKMFAILIWQMVTQSWLSVVVTIALITLFSVGIIYERTRD